MKNGYKYKNQPWEEDNEGTNECWGGNGDGADEEGEESKITIEEIEMKYGDKYNNQPQK